ncbi:CoA transferase [Ancylobacter dichloromethanicus]|uniref:CoA transferase n=2 Tax=Hyphomicrobiales TaxID=356 RepID=A0A9W6J7L9_9HYPH|nr:MULTISPECIES: CoA transferase [Hyphomicrobiales]MBS7554724.1 CoA transferase [Ancylobacter dichloromethanicus]GLK72330.1 CoA transferase [Ancylobacter dichloromethanicus]CAX24328.1 putative coenzyme A transferase; putative formyl-CoA transferase [Methylorubrum extorquens DM4]
MPGPLEGVRVIDLTTVISGPMATMILADQGATVIKVERPEGDYTRQLSTRRGGLSASYLNNNRGKKSVVIDLKDPSGLNAVKQLVADADVFVQNFRPGVAERLGLGSNALCSSNPRLIYTSIVGFGFEGPLADKPTYDPLVQAVSSLATVQAGSDEDRPRLIRTILPDKLTAIQTSQAIVAALLARERSGVGQEIRLSMLDTVVAFLWGSDMNGHTFVNDELHREEAQSFLDLIYGAADGFLSISVMQDKDWEGLARATGRPDILLDPRFADAELREVNREARLTLTQSIVAGFKRDELLARLEAAGVPCAPALTRTEMRHHPQIAANKTLIEYDHPVAGRLRQARTPAQFLGTPTSLPSPAPALGEHTALILGDTKACEPAK